MAHYNRLALRLVLPQTTHCFANAGLAPGPAAVIPSPVWSGRLASQVPAIEVVRSQVMTTFARRCRASQRQTRWRGVLLSLA